MQVLLVKGKEDLSELQKNTSRLKSGCVCALGFFDGVHSAHRALIKEAYLEAEKLNMPLVIFTFSANSPSFKPEHARLFTDEEKLSELQKLGASLVLVFDFDLIKDISACDFIEYILVEKLNTHTAFCGFNFRFGKSAGGDAAMLREKMAELGRHAVIVPEYKDIENGFTLSSSSIRELISKKELLHAARLLGKPFFIDGKVSHGMGLGKKLGFPTVNVGIKDGKLVLPNGVYYTALDISGTLYNGITNVGICPTFDEREAHTETFIFDFDGNIYGTDIRIYFIDFIRDEIKFSSKEELIMQIKIDKNQALKLKKEIRWQEIGLNSQ